MWTRSIPKVRQFNSYVIIMYILEIIFELVFLELIRFLFFIPNKQFKNKLINNVKREIKMCQNQWLLFPLKILFANLTMSKTILEFVIWFEHIIALWHVYPTFNCFLHSVDFDVTVIDPDLFPNLRQIPLAKCQSKSTWSSPINNIAKRINCNLLREIMNFLVVFCRVTQDSFYLSQEWFCLWVYPFGKSSIKTRSSNNDVKFRKHLEEIETIRNDWCVCWFDRIPTGKPIFFCVIFLFSTWLNVTFSGCLNRIRCGKWAKPWKR